MKMDFLIVEAKHERDRLIDKFDAIRTMIQNNVSISEKIDEMQISNYIMKVKDMFHHTKI
ncbi:MAG: hypothetical protein ACXAD7_08190 [Candidatus Kariarchaeaceae archaeon]|jgi:hypothetical protein